MNDFLDNLKDNPMQALIGVVSLSAIIVGLGMGVSRGAFKPDPQQAKLEQAQQSEALRQQQIEIANKRYDDGCEGIFYARPGTNDYAPLSNGTSVLSAAYWNEFSRSGRAPTAVDYLPAGTVVCDVYGNTGILRQADGQKQAVIADIVNTPDRDRIHKMMARYPGGNRHNAANFGGNK